MSTGSVNQKATWTVARVNALRHLDVELRKWPRRGWIAIAWGVTLALIGVAQRPTTDIDGYQGGSAAFWSLLILGGVIALFGVRRLALYRSTRRRQPEIAAVAQWCDDAGPRVITTLLDGGPRLGKDLPVSGDAALGDAWQVGTFGAGHPLLAVGVLAVSGLVNGLSYVKNRSENKRKQAVLTAEYQLFTADRLTTLRGRYAQSRSITAQRRTTLIELTDWALALLPAQPVSLEKGTAPPS
jgi:hypothetical protein